MEKVKPLLTMEDLEQILTSSESGPVMVFKHSTT